MTLRGLYNEKRGGRKESFGKLKVCGMGMRKCGFRLFASSVGPPCNEKAFKTKKRQKVLAPEIRLLGEGGGKESSRFRTILKESGGELVEVAKGESGLKRNCGEQSSLTSECLITWGRRRGT